MTVSKRETGKAITAVIQAEERVELLEKRSRESHVTFQQKIKDAKKAVDDAKGKFQETTGRPYPDAEKPAEVAE